MIRPSERCGGREDHAEIEWCGFREKKGSRCFSHTDRQGKENTIRGKASPR